MIKNNKMANQKSLSKKPRSKKISGTEEKKQPLNTSDNDTFLPHGSYDNSHNQGLQNELLGEWGEILKKLEVRANIVQEKATVLEEAINKNSEKINNLENVLSITNSSFLNIIENQNEYNERLTKRILNALKKWFITLLILIIICCFSNFINFFFWLSGRKKFWWFKSI